MNKKSRKDRKSAAAGAAKGVRVFALCGRMSLTRFVAMQKSFLEAAAVRVSGSLTTSVGTPLVLLI